MVILEGVPKTSGEAGQRLTAIPRWDAGPAGEHADHAALANCVIKSRRADMRADAVAKFREQYKAEGYTSVEELCASPNVDAVYIATPNSLHAEHAITAAKHKKHIIVEKPMAMTLAECDA